jgi:hypothetical protein
MKTTIGYSKSAFTLFAVLASGLFTVTVQAQHFEYKEHHLGPTGLFGITSPTDIKITKVQPGSPADGKIKVDDVIVAAGGIPFKDDTRPRLAAAIDQAETAQAKGILTLTLKDGAKVDLQLKVLGSYSDTAPYQCPKTDAIITRTADHLVAAQEFNSHGLPIDLLGLLATGEPKYIEVVKNQIHSAPWAKRDLSLSIAKYNTVAWSWGYTTLTLCEYYLLTRDEYVLPAIKAYAVALATGRDAAGLWGHGIASLDINRGQLHGRLQGYAVMNQSSLPCFVSLLLADKCGIKHPEVQAGIEQTHTFYADFIGKGTLPYGVHNPNAGSYNNNGMSGLVAVAFALHGKTRGAAFFSRMAAAATNTMETGHTRCPRCAKMPSKHSTQGNTSSRDLLKQCSRRERTCSGRAPSRISVPAARKSSSPRRSRGWFPSCATRRRRSRSGRMPQGPCAGLAKPPIRIMTTFSSSS